MEKFNDPNKPPKEMQFYTWEEFKQFISVIDDIKWKTLFEVLFFCGLRRGELRGLSWDNIDFFNKELSVVKNVVQEGDSRQYILTTPKTRTSTRTLPLPQKVMDDIHELYQHIEELGETILKLIYNFEVLDVNTMSILLKIAREEICAITSGLASKIIPKTPIGQETLYNVKSLSNSRTKSFLLIGSSN